jgi:hypothetical protein
MQDEVAIRVLEMLSDDVRRLAWVCGVHNSLLLAIISGKSSAMDINSLSQALTQLSAVADNVTQVQNKLVFLKQGVAA